MPNILLKIFGTGYEWRRGRFENFLYLPTQNQDESPEFDGAIRKSEDGNLEVWDESTEEWVSQAAGDSSSTIIVDDNF